MKTPTTPMELVDAAYRALDKGDYRTVASFADDDALARFKRSQLEVARLEERVRTDPSRHGRPRYLEGYAVRSLDELEHFPSIELLERYLANQHGNGGNGPFFKGRRSILGVVSEGGDLAHVVVRLEWDAAHEKDFGPWLQDPLLDVVSVRKSARGWRLLLNGGFGWGSGSGGLLHIQAIQ